MITATGFYWNKDKGFQFDRSVSEMSNPDIIFYFFDKKICEILSVYDLVQERFPDSIVFGCSSSGPILNDDLYLDTFTGMAISFEKSKLRTFQCKCESQVQSFDAGKAMVEGLLGDDLRHIFVVTDGMSVHGTDFMNGAHSVRPENVSITGGMSSDGFEFKETFTGINIPPEAGQVCAVGFYGRDLNVGFAAEGGWDKFGPDRLVTKSEGNILYELDGQPALGLYKEYLGDNAKNLPSSGLLFPLAIQKDGDSDLIVRTIDIIDEEVGSLRFTGDIPQGHRAQFMKGYFPNLVKGAGFAAEKAKGDFGGKYSVALIVSCLGRQLLMGQQVNDELEAVMDVLGDMPAAGFYSNGEYSNIQGEQRSVLHNQTMTLTIFQED